MAAAISMPAIAIGEYFVPLNEIVVSERPLPGQKNIVPAVANSMV